MSTRVPEQFDEVASTYDVMVALSPGYHQQLVDSAKVLVEQLPATGGRPLRVVDLGCGSGASTRALEEALVERGEPFQLLGVDGSAGMLEVARAKDWRTPVRFVQDDAEHLDPASWGVGRTVEPDGVFAAYLVRNVTARDALLRRLYDLLRPGGVLVLHDYSVADSKRAQRVWDAVCWGVVVPLGVATAPSSGIYRYLWRSVRDFDGITRLRDRLSSAGFVDVRSRTFKGWQRGVVHTVTGRRPE